MVVPLLLLLLGPASSDLRSVRPGWWDIRVQVPAFRSAGPVAAAANREARRLAQLRFDRFVAEAKREMPAIKKMERGVAYAMVSDATVTLDTASMASAYWETYAYNGGAHGFTSYTVVNRHRSNGVVQPIRLRDLFHPGTDPVREASAAVLEVLLKAKDAPSWVEDGSWNGLDPAEADQFVVTRKSLVFLFGSYALGSYAEGTWKVEVPFERLAGLNRNRLPR